MVEHSCETIGYFSRVNGEMVDPMFITLDLEEIKKINKDRASLNISKQMLVADNKVNIGNLLKFLEDKHVFNQPLKENEFNVVCPAKVLFILLLKYRHDIAPQDFKFYKYFHEKTTVIEECHTDQSVSDERKLSTDNGQVAEILLSLLPDGTTPKVHSANTLCIVVKHRFVYSNGMIINLYLSKGIHSVLKKDREMIPVYMKYCPYHTVSTKAMFEKCRWNLLAYNYLVGGLCSFLALPARDDENVVEKVFVIDNLGAVVAASVVYALEVYLPHFLQMMVGLSYGTLQKSVYIFTHGRPYQNILISEKDGEHIKSIGTISTVGAPLPLFTHECKEHELVIVGSYNGAIPYHHHLYNADFVTLKRFRLGIFRNLLRKPKHIKFYGTASEYRKLRDYMDANQRAILSFANDGH